MSEDKTYNGWTNYATWGVGLVLDNDEGTYNRANELAEQARTDAHDDSRVSDGIWTREQAARFNLADQLKDFTEELCGLGGELFPEPTLMASQLLGSALADVNWDELADHYLNALPEEERWIVIESTPGYMPDSEPADFDNYSDAVAYANELADKLEEQGYQCDRSWASSGNYYAIKCKRSDTVAPDLGRFIAVERDES